MQWSQWLKLVFFGLFLMAQTSSGLAATVIPDNGPSSGGNNILITNCVPEIGNGDITNILVGAIGTTNVTGQGTNWVLFVTPANAAGVKDIVIQSTSIGDTTFAGTYTVNPAGQIGGTLIQDWTQWEEVAGSPAPRARLAAGVLDGALYAVGGDDGATAQTNVYRYNGTNWTEVAGLPAPRTYLAAGVLNGELYAVGGIDNDDSVCTNAYRYDGTNWTEVGGLPLARAGLAAGVLNGALYAIGGARNGTYTNVFRYDGTNWSEVAGMPAARDCLGAGVLNGVLYAVGGEYLNFAHTNVYHYNGTNWTEVAGLPAARVGLAVGVLNGALYAVGGIGNGEGGITHTNVYRYDGANWTEVAGLPSARVGVAVEVLNGALYVVGGKYEYTGQAQTNVYRYPRVAGIDPGVSPSSGSTTGGYAVVITGTNLCDGTPGDITSVTLCGVSAAVTGVAGSTQIIVTAGAATPGLGDVAVHSTGYGMTVKSNAFEYEVTEPSFAITNPAAGASVRVGSRLSIAWTGAWPLEVVDVELWRGTNFVRVLTNNLVSPDSNGVWTVLLRPPLPRGTDYWVTVTDVDEPADSTASGDFTILPGGLPWLHLLLGQ